MAPAPLSLLWRPRPKTTAIRLSSQDRSSGKTGGQVQRGPLLHQGRISPVDSASKGHSGSVVDRAVHSAALAGFLLRSATLPARAEAWWIDLSSFPLRRGSAPLLPLLRESAPDRAALSSARPARLRKASRFPCR